ncbi:MULTISPECIES: hypothetical protein [unclassified Viridibacillus]|uniref:hypothetical protein n=1 Tax=unclassified Viridibacillus TaxID=2617942 RepID=UPI0030F52FBD
MKEAFLINQRIIGIYFSVGYQPYIKKYLPLYNRKNLNVKCFVLFQLVCSDLGIIHTDSTEFANTPKTKKTVEELENEVVAYDYFEKDELRGFLDALLPFGKAENRFIFNLLTCTGMR